MKTKMKKRTKKETGQRESKALNIADFQNAVKGKNLYRDGALIGEVTNIRRIPGKAGATFSLIVHYGGNRFSDVLIGDRKAMQELAENGRTTWSVPEAFISHTFTLKERRK